MVNADTKGRVLWSAGSEGTVRWWGGKSAKILSKSALCEGTISALEMDETVVVAGYSEQGMEAWDVRTQQTLCTFSNRKHGGVQALQFDNRKLVSVSSTGKVGLPICKYILLLAFTYICFVQCAGSAVEMVRTQSCAMV